MSSLTKDTEVYYVPVFYDENRNFIREGCEYYHEDSAIEDAQKEIAKEVEKTGKYMYAIIERQVHPIYR